MRILLVKMSDDSADADLRIVCASLDNLGVRGLAYRSSGMVESIDVVDVEPKVPVRRGVPLDESEQDAADKLYAEHPEVTAAHHIAVPAYPAEYRKWLESEYAKYAEAPKQQPAEDPPTARLRR